MFGFGMGARFLCNHGCLKLASFWQKIYRAETHFSLVCISGCFEYTYVRTYNPSGYSTSATCIVSCQAITELRLDLFYDSVNSQCLL